MSVEKLETVAEKAIREAQEEVQVEQIEEVKAELKAKLRLRAKTKKILNNLDREIAEAELKIKQALS